MTDLQEKINALWGNLTDEEREEWWSEGDRVNYDNAQYWVLEVRRWIYEQTPHCELSLDNHLSAENTLCTPTPCPQFWWKLEARLGEHLMKITRYDSEDIDEGEMGWAYLLSFSWNEYENLDRRHALLDAAIAIQER